ncbi:MAG: type II secretion system protein [Desulfobulbaceae bacterium]|jgi:MSHA biogenesis protein MshO|nr:type II secretion system protein [Desulfobulbaceae bacterium]
MRNSHSHIASGFQEGFTLIELVTVILLLGIMGAFGGELILQSFRSVRMASDLAVLYEEGKLAMVRMEKEIHHAIPNAIDVQTIVVPGDAISFGKIDTDAQQGVFGQYEEVMSTDVITDPTAIPSNGSILSIYNTSWADFDNGTTNKLYKVIPPSAGNSMTLAPNVPAAGHSPNRRYYVSEDTAVQFRVSDGVLERRTAPLDTSGAIIVLGVFGNPQPLASNISQTDSIIPYFRYEAGVTSRNAVVIINFTINNPGSTISLPFSKEVQVRNVP